MGIARQVSKAFLLVFGMAFYSNICVWCTAESNQKSPLSTDVISSKVNLIPLLLCIKTMLAAYCLLDAIVTF